MSHDEQLAARAELAQLAGLEAERLALHLIMERGYPADAVLAGMITQLSGLGAAAFGGAELAASLEDTAAKVKSWPKRADLGLAAARPAGHA